MIVRLLPFLTATLGLWATTLAATSATNITDALPPLPAGQQWKLVWQDEFEGTRLDASKWDVCGDWKRRDGFWVKEDAYLNGRGQLVLRTKKDGERYTCGAVRTLGKFEHAHGYWVARCKLPREPGHWPAFWLMCGGVNTVGNDGRDGTEIDIAEFPWRDGRTTMNLHWDGYGKAHKYPPARRSRFPPSPTASTPSACGGKRTNTPSTWTARKSGAPPPGACRKCRNTSS
jgi:beta-glucanase (GH16 family)